MLKYDSIQGLIRQAEERKIPISSLVLEDQARDMELSPRELYLRMDQQFEVMLQAVERGSDPDQRSMSGLTGGEGYRMQAYAREGKGLCGSFVDHALARALAVAGHNASMGKIVAAPTAGSCGILPGCLVSMYQDRGTSWRDTVMSIFTAGAFGMVIAANASISGAQGGCQAECGSAAAMAAAALVELMGGTPGQCGDACAIAIANQLGLVCDPVAGLVEIPCIKRNAAGVMIALSSADMALAGIGPRIPVDECIEAMERVGRALPDALRETAAGGLAATPTGQRLRRQVFGAEETQ